MDHSESRRLLQADAMPGTEVRWRNTAPAIHRGSMVPRPWTGFFDGLRGRGVSPAVAETRVPLGWERAASRRRKALLWAIGASALTAAVALAHAHPLGDHPALHIAQIALYTLLFAWVSGGFITAMMGFLVQVRGDKHALDLKAAAKFPIPASTRTAIVMPICNEQVSTTFAGLSATCESLAATGASRLFDVYILSDSSDLATRNEEVAAWMRLRDTLGNDGDGIRIHYRWRQRRTRRKAGNIADFCRRWGRNYKHMVVLDADSVMTGDCLVSLVRLMEANPNIGILQTAPVACGLNTLHARSQQFAGRVTGRLFTAGMQFWQLGESHYWGHNAIIRIEPFMKHCALASLPGEGGLSGEILSHDFVEAALMRRAGYHVWLVPELAGSYEQVPPNLLEELRRDRRWCQGNLQNARLIAEPGLHSVHRGMLGAGAMAYLSAPLWLLFVVLGTLAWLTGDDAPASSGFALPAQTAVLWGCTVAMLSLPRILGIAAIAMRRESHLYGGLRTLCASALFEGLMSACLAPLRMVAHSLFVLVALTGLKLDWKSPPREANAVSWSDAGSAFGMASGVAFVFLSAALIWQPSLALWLAPIAVPLLLAVPLSVVTSLPKLGERLRATGLLRCPEETRVPVVLRAASSRALLLSRRSLASMLSVATRAGL